MTSYAAGMTDQGEPVPVAIDRAVLREWLGEDDAAIDELLGVFATSIATEFGRLSDQLLAGDLPAFARTAHRLRGAALSMGARELAAVAATLDHAARAGDAGNVRAGFPALRLQVDRAIAEVPRLH